MGIADREWGGRQAPREAAGRARGLMCLGWDGKRRHENFVSVGCPAEEAAAVWVCRTDSQTDGRIDCRAGGVSSGHAAGWAALCGARSVSPRCPEVAPPAPPRRGCPAGPGPVSRRARE